MNAQSWQMVASVLFGMTAMAISGPVMQLIDWISTVSTRRLTAQPTQLGLELETIRIWQRWWWAFTALLVLFIAFTLKMPPVAVLAGTLLVQVPRIVLSLRLDNRRIKFRDQIVSAARALSAQFRAGLSTPEGLRAVARESRSPLREELMECVQSFDRGEGLRESLTALKKRIDVDAVSLFVIALLATERQGGKITVAMEKISDSLEQMQRVERTRESNTAGGRALVIVLALFPALFALMFSLIDPASMGLLFSTFSGQIAICIVALLTYVAVRWAFWLLAVVD